MPTNNLAKGDTINLLQEFNKKLEGPLLQEDMGLEAASSAPGQAIRYDEYNAEHDPSTGKHDPGFLTDTYVSATAAIKASKLAIHQNYKKVTAVVPSATAATNGTAVVLSPPTGYSMIAPLGLDIVFGGTFGSETVTVTITYNYADSTNTSVTYTATAVGTTSLTNSQLMAEAKDGTYITSISTVAKSTIASTTATVTLNRYGLYL